MNVVKGVLGINDAPPPPDYTAAAKATADGNLAMAKTATEANRADQVNPYGQVNWTKTANPDGTDKWTQTTSLSNTGQQLFDQQNKTSLGLAGLQDQATGRVTAAQDAGWNDAALTSAGTALDTSAYKPGSVVDSTKFTGGGTALSDTFSPSGAALDASSVKGGNALQHSGATFNFTAGPTGGAAVKDGISYYDSSKVGDVGKVYDPNQDTNTATQAILARVNPQLDRRRAATENQLANQGITRGSEAWNNAMTDLGQQENDAYTQAGLQGINLGMSQQGQTYGQTMGNRSALSQDQQVLAGQQLGARGQDIQQAGINAQAATAAAQIGMQGQIAGQQMGLQAQQQAFAQQQANAQLELAAQGQAFGQNTANDQLDLAAQGQRFGQNLSNSTQQAGLQAQQFAQGSANNSQQAALQNQQFGQANSLRSNGIQEQNYFANRDLNQLNALRSGSQVTNPTFGNYAQQQTTAGADMLSATNMNYQGQVAANNANNANSFGVIKGIGGFFGG